ncbi:MAG: cyanophycinase [Bernardetiaceae bacterium]|jgi:cyanophycinase|nr:cyanophycinase [Bernardetiaceae bacterium]
MKNFASPWVLLAAVHLAACGQTSPEPAPAPVAAEANPVQTWVVGDTADVQTVTRPGCLLAGGSTDVDEAMRWLIERSGGGDFVVLRASGADGYNSYLYRELGGVNSCQTFLVNSREKAANPTLLRRVRQAEALFIAGGDQANYVNFWKDTPLHQTIQHLVQDRRVPVGGTSAGCAILGQAYFAALQGTVTSETALANPLAPAITLGHHDFLQIPYLQNTITDTHYDNPDRRGRHLVFLARLLAQTPSAPARGIGVPERTAVVVEADGTARVMGRGPAVFAQATGPGPETLQAGQPLHWDRRQQAVQVYELPPGGSFNLANWQQANGGQWFNFWVNQGQLMVNPR